MHVADSTSRCNGKMGDWSKRQSIRWPVSLVACVMERALRKFPSDEMKALPGGLDTFSAMVADGGVCLADCGPSPVDSCRQIGRASGRGRGEISGGAGSLKKKQQHTTR